MQIVKEDLEIDESDISYIIISIENLRWILVCILFTELFVMVLRELLLLPTALPSNVWHIQLWEITKLSTDRNPIIL
jgi:hypothetical protein